MLLLILFLLPIGLLHSQVHGRGALLNKSIFENCPRAPALMQRDIINLPRRVSLKKYAPTPGDQGSLSTCSGWAIAYSARTMVAAIQNNWDKAEIDSNAFSPSFIYNQIRMHPGCNSGTSIVQGLNILKTEGVLSMKNFSYNCDLVVKDYLKELALKNKIKEYRTIAYRDKKNKVILVKKSLDERNPVVIAMNCPDSFEHAGEVWNPDSTDYTGTFGGHALVVIGYDDDKYGGAFEVINSWGTDWGKGGFSWIRYRDFIHFCVWAGEEIPRPEQNKNIYDLSGSVLLTLNSGQMMKLNYNGKYFKTQDTYPSGTRFNLILSNHEPAYVYAIGSDLTYKCKVIFPFNKKINPYLPYKQNDIALPGKGYNFQLDKTTGKTYLWFLYSPIKLAIDSIAESIEESNGDFYDRLQKVLEGKLVSGKNLEVTLEKTGIVDFASKSRGKNIMSLLVEVSHSAGK